MVTTRITSGPSQCSPGPEASTWHDAILPAMAPLQHNPRAFDAQPPSAPTRRLRGRLAVSRDDGQGLPASYLPGVGHHAMQERAAELGGSVTIEQADGGGTCVTATFPLKGAVDA